MASLLTGTGEDDYIYLGSGGEVRNAMRDIEQVASGTGISHGYLCNLPDEDEDFDPDYLAKVREQASEVLAECRDRLAPSTVGLLEQLTDDANFASYNDPGDAHWVTVNGHHLLINGKGDIKGGSVPRALHGTNIEGFKKDIKESSNVGRSDIHGSRESGSGSTGSESSQDGGRVAGASERPHDTSGSTERENQDRSANSRSASRVPASVGEVNKRIDRFANLFRSRGNHQVADFLEKLREHVNEVGTEEALRSLGEDHGAGDNDVTAYEGEKAGWEDMSAFGKAYLDRFGIVSTHDATPLPGARIVSSVATKKYATGKYKDANEGSYKVQNVNLANKLEEAKHLPGLEKSEDLGKLLGKDQVDNLTPEHIQKLDETYGKGQWIVKPYGDEAYAGYGIFFPQRAEQIQRDAAAAIWASGEHLAKYGFSHLRDPNTGNVIGIKHTNGDEYLFGKVGWAEDPETGRHYLKVEGTPKYNDTIHGDARHWADQAALASVSEHGAVIPPGQFMAQPAFPVVGISNEERAQGVTFKTGQEGRTHIVTRNGKAELVPHSTWLKNEHLPVVFENDDTRAMAQAALDAINALPESEKQGQIYAPDIVKTAAGFKIVEANPANAVGASGYLGDNPFIIDSYVSHLTNRDPAHVRFIRQILSKKSKGETKFNYDPDEQNKGEYDPNSANVYFAQPDDIGKEDMDSLMSAVDKHSHNGAADLADVREEMLHYAREQQDRILHHARESGLVNILPLDAKLGATDRQKDAALQHGGQNYGFVERKDVESN